MEWNDVLDDLDFELIEMTDQELDAFAASRARNDGVVRSLRRAPVSVRRGPWRDVPRAA